MQKLARNLVTKNVFNTELVKTLKIDTDIQLGNYSISSTKAINNQNEYTNKKYVDAAIASSHIDSSTNKLNVFDFCNG